LHVVAAMISSKCPSRTTAHTDMKASAAPVNPSTGPPAAARPSRARAMSSVRSHLRALIDVRDQERGCAGV
jgi:hypothetical protein